MSELLEKQMLFARMVADLIIEAHRLGFDVTLGDAYRDPRVPYGHPKSLHKLRLAIDINLFEDEQYLTQSEDYQLLGEYWELIGGTWGGRFLDENGKPAPDGNHFSLAYRGMK